MAGEGEIRARLVDFGFTEEWAIDVENPGFAARVQIANPVAFLAQKILIHRRRERQGRAKDILYIHDTLEVFGAQLQELADVWRNEVAAHPRGAAR